MSDHMDCATAGDLLPDRVGGTMTAPEAARLDAHLAACASCTADLELVAFLHAQRPVVPADLTARIQAALREGSGVSDSAPARPARLGRPSVRPLSRARYRVWALASAAILVLALGTSLFLDRTSDPSDEEVWATFFDGVRSVWVAGDGVVAGAPLLGDLSDLSDDALVALLEDLGG